jgi:hypothetical protein
MLLSAPHTCNSVSLYPDVISTRLYATLQNWSLNTTCPNSTPVSATFTNTSFYGLICIHIRTVRLFQTTGTVGQLAHCITRTGTSRAAHVSEGILPNNIRPKCGNKMPTRCNRCFLLQILLLVQHVSGTIMPIIKSSRVLYRWLLPVAFGEGCLSGLRAAAILQQPANLTHNPQLHTIPTS